MGAWYERGRGWPQPYILLLPGAKDNLRLALQGQKDGPFNSNPGGHQRCKSQDSGAYLELDRLGLHDHGSVRDLVEPELPDLGVAVGRPVRTEGRLPACEASRGHPGAGPVQPVNTGQLDLTGGAQDREDREDGVQVQAAEGVWEGGGGKSGVRTGAGGRDDLVGRDEGSGDKSGCGEVSGDKSGCG